VEIASSPCGLLVMTVFQQYRLFVGRETTARWRSGGCLDKKPFLR
jgi:hypothetical protein